MALKCLDFIDKLPLRSHSALFYVDSLEKHWRLLKYLYSALVRGYAALYLTPQNEVEYIEGLMGAFGIKVPQYEKRNQLRVLSSNEFYLEKNEADKEKIISTLTELSKEAVANGFNGLFVAGDMSCFFDEGLESELIDYELSLGRELSMDAAGLCLYEASRIYPLDKQFKTDLIRAHGSLIFPLNIIELIPPDSSKERLALKLLRIDAERAKELGKDDWKRAEIVVGRLIAIDRHDGSVVMDTKDGEEWITRRFSIKGWSNDEISELLIHLGDELEAEVIDSRLEYYKMKR